MSRAVRMQNQKLIALSERANYLKEQEIAETKRHNISEEETKDRVDVSKKEYLYLLNTVKELKSDLFHAKDTLQKILSPLIKNKINERIYQKIVDNNFEVEVKVFDDGMLCEQKVAIVYKIPLEERI